MNLMAVKSFQNLKRLARIWRQTTFIHFYTAGGSSWHTVLAYAIGKILRMGFFIVFVLALFQNGKTIAGYDKGEMLLFWAMMNLVDSLFQMFWLRGFMTLARDVRTGSFDFVLVRPLSPLFWTATHIFDVFDLITVPAIIWSLWFAVHNLSYAIAPTHLALTLLMVLVSLGLAFGVCLTIAALTFWTTEMYNAWWLLRDGVYAARFPPEIYPVAIRTIFSFVIPLFVLTAFPAKALLGLLSPITVIWSIVIALGFNLLGALLWRRGLQRYSSASS